MARTNLLVTGGCGFIGSNFIHYLFALKKGGEQGPAGFEPGRVINLDKLSYAGNLANLRSVENERDYEFVQGDIADAALVARLLRDQQIGLVVNFAAESHVDRSIDSPEPFVQTNVVGTLRLLDAARRHWLSLPAETKDAFRFLHVSTDEVYGSLAPDAPAFTEKNAYEPNSPYAASKASSDHLVRAFHHTYGLPTLLTNCSNNYGPYQFPEKLIPLVILNCLEGRPLPIYGDGGNVRDWLYVLDHCRAIVDVLAAGRLGECYNIGGLNERTNLEVVDAICAALDELQPRADGAGYQSLKTFVPDRPGHDRRYAIDCGRLQSELGWRPREDFSSGLRKTVAWYLKERDWCRNVTERCYNRERLGLAQQPATSTSL